MKDQVFNGIPVPRDCVFCKYHPSNAAKTGGTQPTDVQQLKAEILPLLIRALDEGTVSIETNDIRGYVKEAVVKLSAAQEQIL